MATARLALLVAAMVGNAAATLSPPPPTNNTYCETCEKVAAEVMANGCEWAKTGCASLPTPENALCTYVFITSGLCPYLVKLATPYAVCKDVGLCGTECECGVCTNSTAGPHGRCLGVPNSCGHVPASTFEPAKTQAGICLDGQCGDKDSVGCCLTCL